MESNIKLIWFQFGDNSYYGTINGIIVFIIGRTKEIDLFNQEEYEMEIEYCSCNSSVTMAVETGTLEELKLKANNLINGN